MLEGDTTFLWQEEEDHVFAYHSSEEISDKPKGGEEQM